MNEPSAHNLAHAETVKSALAKIDLEDQQHAVFAIRELPIIKQGGLGAGVSPVPPIEPRAHIKILNDTSFVRHLYP